MSSVGHRPTLHELLECLHAIERVEADTAALDPAAEKFRVVLTFQRVQCPIDWVNGQPKPSWMFEQLIEELSAWLQQRNREEQWVSKEERMGSSLDGLMAHYAEELKKSARAVSQNIVTRMQTRVYTDTVLRLKELKERREAGGVYSATESRREKARKSWEEEEFEAPKREEQQRQQRAKDNPNPFEHYEKFFEDAMRGTWGDYMRGRRQQSAPPQTKANNKQPWHVILGVPASATKAEITKAHRKLVAKHQPRTSIDAEDKARNDKMAEINTARDEGLGGL